MALSKWQKYVQKNMAKMMKKHKGNHGKAMTELGRDWQKMKKKKKR